MRATAQRRIAVEALEQGRQVAHDAPERDFRTVHQVVAFKAVPFKGIQGASGRGISTTRP